MAGVGVLGADSGAAVLRPAGRVSGRVAGFKAGNPEAAASVEVMREGDEVVLAVAKGAGLLVVWEVGAGVPVGWLSSVTGSLARLPIRLGAGWVVVEAGGDVFGIAPVVVSAAVEGAGPLLVSLVLVELPV